MRIHLIAIGGAVMHNLAIVLSRMGNKVTGSDDAINDPAKTNLANEGLLPDKIGFFTENISAEIDIVILGMHARAENPELLEAKKLRLKIVSFPEFIYEISKDKKRVVIAGSHGKTTVTSMIMHVLNVCKMDFDYMVGAKLKGFDTSVKLTTTAPVIILEGDEYLASPLQRESKFMFYKPHIALITGIAWDHINVFPVYSNYVNQFLKFANSIEPNGTLVCCAEDKELQHFSTKLKSDLKVKYYSVPPHKIVNGTTFVHTENGEIALEIFGKHNLMNMEGARLICENLGVPSMKFYEAIKTFEGAANRLQLLYKSEFKIVFKDFAHSPSKVKATVSAVREQFPDMTLVCVLELHTFSSLNEDFLPQYESALDDADVPLIFLDKHAFELKKMPMLSEQKVKDGFKNQAIEIIDNKEELAQKLELLPSQNVCFLFMSSGTFGGFNLNEIAK